MSLKDLEQWLRDEIARVQAGLRREDPMPSWAGPDPEPPHDPRPDAKVIPLFPQPDGTRCACSTWGQASCRVHRSEVRE